MNFEVIKSKYTAKDVKKLLTFKRLFKMTSVIGILRNKNNLRVIGLSMLFFLVVHFFVWYDAYSVIPICDRRIIIIGIILYLFLIYLTGVFFYYVLFGNKKEIILRCYREADRLCKDLLTEQMKSGLFHADVYVDTQRNEIVAIIKGNYLGTKQVYHFDRYLQQIIDEEKKIIDLSKLDQIFGLENV